MHNLAEAAKFSDLLTTMSLAEGFILPANVWL